MSCENCLQIENECECPIKDLNFDCLLYTGTTPLLNIGTSTNTIGTQVLLNINTALGDIKNMLSDYFRLDNIGSGLNIYAGISNLGIRQIRTLVEGSNINLTENPDNLTLSVPNSSESIAGVLPIATQTEVDLGVVNNKAVTPLTLNSFIPTPTIFDSTPTDNSTNGVTSNGIYEALVDINSFAALNSVSGEKIADTTILGSKIALETITSANLANNSVTNSELSDNAVGVQELDDSITGNPLVGQILSFDGTNLDWIDPSGQPDASETTRGIIEIATQAEVNTATDDTKAVTPLKLNTAIENAKTTPDFLESNPAADSFIANKNASKTVILGPSATYNVLDSDNNYIIEIDNSVNSVTIDLGTVTITSNFFVGFIQKGTGTVTITGADSIPADFTNQIYGEGHAASIEIINSTKYLLGTLVAV